MGGCTGRPTGEEALEKLPMLVADRKRIDMYAIALEAIYGLVRRGCCCNPRDEAVTCALEIRHTGSAVVDHREAPVRQRSVVQQGKAGVGRCEYIDVRPGPQISGQSRRCGNEVFAREAPARERGPVAMHQADAQAADFG